MQRDTKKILMRTKEHKTMQQQDTSHKKLQRKKSTSHKIRNNTIRKRRKTTMKTHKTQAATDVKLNRK